MGQETYPTIWLKLAALLDSIERNHPLLDGNKSLGYLAVALVLRGNGIDERRVSNEDWYDLINQVDADHMELEALAAELQNMVEGHDSPTLD